MQQYLWFRFYLTKASYRVVKPSPSLPVLKNCLKMLLSKHADIELAGHRILSSSQTEMSIFPQYSFPQTVNTGISFVAMFLKPLSTFAPPSCRLVFKTNPLTGASGVGDLSLWHGRPKRRPTSFVAEGRQRWHAFPGRPSETPLFIAASFSL